MPGGNPRTIIIAYYENPTILSKQLFINNTMLIDFGIQSIGRQSVEADNPSILIRLENRFRAGHVRLKNEDFEISFEVACVIVMEVSR